VGPCSGMVATPMDTVTERGWLGAVKLCSTALRRRLVCCA